MRTRYLVLWLVGALAASGCEWLISGSPADPQQTADDGGQGGGADGSAGPGIDAGQTADGGIKSDGGTQSDAGPGDGGSGSCQGAAIAAHWRELQYSGSSIRGIGGTADTDVWFAADGHIYHWNGQTFASTGMPPNFAGTQTAVWAYAPDKAWSSGFWNVLSWDGSGTWTESYTSGSFINGIWGSSPNDVWAVGNSGLVVQWNGTKWTDRSAGISSELLGVWGVDSAHLYAVGASGTMISNASGSWADVNLGTGDGLNGIFGTSATDIWVVGDRGTLFHRDNFGWSKVTNLPTAVNLNAVWAGCPKDVWIAGDKSTLLHYDGSGWAQVQTSSIAWSNVTDPSLENLYGIWGTPGGSVYAAGTRGLVLRSGP